MANVTCQEPCWNSRIYNKNTINLLTQRNRVGNRRHEGRKETYSEAMKRAWMMLFM